MVYPHSFTSAVVVIHHFPIAIHLQTVVTGNYVSMLSQSTSNFFENGLICEDAGYFHTVCLAHNNALCKKIRNLSALLCV